MKLESGNRASKNPANLASSYKTTPNPLPLACDMDMLWWWLGTVNYQPLKHNNRNGILQYFMYWNQNSTEIMRFESFVFLHYNLYWKVLSMKNNVVSLDFISTINTIQKYVHILIQIAQKEFSHPIFALYDHQILILYIYHRDYNTLMSHY